MKNLKNLSLLMFCATLTMNVSAQDDEPDFAYSNESEIGRNTSLFALDISPLKIGYQGSYVTFGIGARALVSDLQDKFSASFGFEYNYSNFSTNKNQLSTVVENYEDKSTSSFGGVLGYSFKSETSNETWTVRLKKSGNVEYVADLPTKVIRRYEARLGFDRVNMLSRGDITYSDTVYDDWGNNPVLSEFSGTFLLNQHQSMLSIGIGKKTSADNVYKTDKFGVVTNSVESALYADVLFGIGGTLPPFFKVRYDDPYYPNEITSIEPLSANASAGVEESFSKLPVGIRIGYMDASRKMHNFSWDVQLALYPGYYRSIGELVQLKVGLSYRFTKLLK